MRTRLIITGLVLMAATTLASAQSQGKGKGDGTGNYAKGSKNTAFVDSNNNGVCDNYENRKANDNSSKKGKGIGNCDGTGRGKGKGKGMGQGKGKNFIDANNNGICDRKE